MNFKMVGYTLYATIFILISFESDFTSVVAALPLPSPITNPSFTNFSASFDNASMALS